MTQADPIPDPAEEPDTPTDRTSIADGDSSPVLIATGVHITYRTYLDGKRRLRSRLPGAKGGGDVRYKDVHAVRGVDLTLREGESLGLIGANGSGKSSLLTGMAGLIAVTEGEVIARSRPALLGVGAALNRRLSGRRNIEIGCLALGLSRAEVEERMDSIIEFTGLSASIDLPMDTYSSGMRARLIFSIATEFAPDILFIDEALAVGDRTFRQRAEQRLAEIRASAGSMIVVSHNLGEIERMSTRVAWLDQGKVVMEGDPASVLEAYQAAFPEQEAKDVKAAARKARRREKGADRRRAQRHDAHAEGSNAQSEANVTAAKGEPTTDSEASGP